ncbi:hypothetical protein Spock_10 [Bacillus phage Spock]|uniref:Uncharacterized protein n=1 Tax=Bacillus phage Spock TaxID=1406791 RepID=U5PWM7_9CAUD|nr:hypothetical protein Spock_10 [Bacillus phage Spock]AGY48410.1 hypothetical protein Spock_10 [Bacillus phage Spock]
MVDVFARLKKVFGVEPEEKQLDTIFVELEKNEVPEPEEQKEQKEEVTQEEEPEVKEEVKVREPFPIEVGDILYKCDVIGGEPHLDWNCMKVEVTSINEEKDTFIAEPAHRDRHPYLYRDEMYLFSVKDMMRQPFLDYKKGYSKEKALTYREKLVMENELWRGKPKAGDIFYGKLYHESDKTYGTLTQKYKVLGVTLEVFSAAPVNKDNEVNELETLIFNNDTLFEVALHDTAPVQLFTTQDNAHTAYLHKQIEKKNREAKQ